MYLAGAAVAGQRRLNLKLSSLLLFRDSAAAPPIKVLESRTDAAPVCGN